MVSSTKPPEEERKKKVFTKDGGRQPFKGRGRRDDSLSGYRRGILKFSVTKNEVAIGEIRQVAVSSRKYRRRSIVLLVYASELQLPAVSQY